MPFTLVIKSRIYQYILSSEFPDQEPYMVPVDQNAGLSLVVEVRPEVYTTYHMPTSPVLFFVAFLDVLRCILQVRYLSLHHLVVDIFSH